MVALLFVVIELFILAVILFFMSSIKLKLNKFIINDYSDLNNILVLFRNKKYIDSLNYIESVFTIEICLFNIIPIIKKQFNNKDLEKIIIKQKNKKVIDKIKIEKNKNRILNIISEMKFEKIKLLMYIGTENSNLTAIYTSIINIMLSIIIAQFASTNNKNYIYDVKPKYADENFFKIDSSATFSFPIHKIIACIK